MKHHVVLADDVASIRAVVRAALETDGRFVIVGETADGPATVEMVDALGPDLLVLDLGMPASDGIATLAGIAARHPGLGIIVYSERVDQERLALAAGARAFVRKSADVSELLDALEIAATRLAPKPLRPGEIQDFERLVLDAIDEGFVVQDSGGAIVYANPAAERILDLRADEMVGLTSKDPRWGAVLPDGTPFPADEHPIVRARLTGRPVQGVLMGARSSTGELRWMQVSAAPLVQGTDGAAPGAVALFTDVTEELSAKGALRASEERFRTAVETMRDGFMIWRAVRDADERIVDFVCEFANEAVGESAYAPANVVGRRLLDLSPRLSATYFDQYVAVVETGQPLRIEVPWYEGARIHGAFDVSAVRMGDGVALAFRDITERLREQAALRESEEQTKRFLEAIPVGLAVVEPGQVVFVNQAGRDILGSGVDTDMRGPGLVDAFRLRRAGTGEPYPFEELPLYRALFEGVAVRVDDLIMTTDERDVPVETSAAPVSDATGEPRFALTVISDITERRAQEQRLADAVDELAAVNEELTEFAGVAAHDLAAPLRAIAGFAQLLDQKYGDALEGEGRAWIAYMLAESDRMRSFIEELLEYSRAGVIGASLVPVDLAEVAAGARDALRAAIVETDACVEIGPLPGVMGDPTALGQVFQNLLANALKFRAPGRAPSVSVEAERVGDEWLVTVADDGIGVPEIDRTRIFTPFHRGSFDAEPAGHGLGLSICRRVVERHRGRIWVEPRVEGGSRFRFSLPDPEPGPARPELDAD